jgi:hypothetical protein
MEITVFRDVTPCSFVDRHPPFEGICYPEDEKSGFLQNVSASLQNYTVSHPRRL